MALLLGEPCQPGAGPRARSPVAPVAPVTGLVLNAAAGLWRADPIAALVIACYAVREALEIFRLARGG